MLVVLVVLACMCLVAAAIVLVGLDVGGVLDGGGGGGGPWREAAATWYMSYAPCCKDNPNYDPRADTSECDSFSACKYSGMFAGYDDKKSFEWVRDNDITAFFETGQTMDTWRKKWAGKTLLIRKKGGGKTMRVTVADTCGDNDCGGCCTRNAAKGGGYLVDLELNTAKRFWGDDVPGESTLEWKCVDC